MDANLQGVSAGGALVGWFPTLHRRKACRKLAAGSSRRARAGVSATGQDRTGQDRTCCFFHGPFGSGRGESAVSREACRKMQGVRANPRVW